jgi:hypothetical protein
MEGRVFKYFWHTRMAGVVEYPCGIDRIIARQLSSDCLTATSSNTTRTARP